MIPPVRFYHQHPGCGLPCPGWCECAVCNQPLQENRAIPLYDDGWEFLDPHHYTDDGDPVCSRCVDELDLVGGEVVLLNEWAEQRATA